MDQGGKIIDFNGPGQRDRLRESLSCLKGRGRTEIPFGLNEGLIDGPRVVLRRWDGKCHCSYACRALTVMEWMAFAILKHGEYEYVLTDFDHMKAGGEADSFEAAVDKINRGYGRFLEIRDLPLSMGFREAVPGMHYRHDSGRAHFSLRRTWVGAAWTHEQIKRPEFRYMTEQDLIKDPRSGETIDVKAVNGFRLGFGDGVMGAAEFGRDPAEAAWRLSRRRPGIFPYLPEGLRAEIAERRWN
ncbi:MAG: hypothetical protein J6Y62_10095 [Clostridia bacterium]|nr:hypothetical protein [Clostridia bacterium]